MFQWVRALGLYPVLNILRQEISHYAITLPGWTIYSLPDALWVFSITAILAIIWEDSSSTWKLFWLSIGPCLGIGGELSQLTRFVPGTFDPIDLALISIAGNPKGAIYER
jgi:hypothetical protein